MFYSLSHKNQKGTSFHINSSLSLTISDLLFALFRIVSFQNLSQLRFSSGIFFRLIKFTLCSELDGGDIAAENKWREMLKAFLCKFRDNSFFPHWGTGSEVRMVLLKIPKSFLWNSRGLVLDLC